MEPGAKSDEAAEMHAVRSVKLSELEWRVLMALKRELVLDEITENLWGVARARGRSAAAGLLRGRRKPRRAQGDRAFLDFLEHVKPTAPANASPASTRSSLAVPAGREIEAGREIGRHHI